MKLKDIANKLNGTLIGDGDSNITCISSLEDHKKNSVVFILEKKHIQSAKSLNASAYIVFKKIEGLDNQIIIKHPKKALVITIELLYKEQLLQYHNINPIKIESLNNECIHKNTIIGENTVIGKNAIIYPNVFIGKSCTIGDNVIIYPNVSIYNNTIIEDNVVLHANSVIGGDGFGYYYENNTHVKIPHIGHVILEQNVEVGSNSSVDRGCLGVTIVKKGTKIDNLVQIGHNCNIGSNTLIVAQSGASGSVKIGNNTIIGGQTGIYKNIGNNVVVGGKSGITKPISDNSVVSGFPAQNHRTELKQKAKLNKLLRIT